MKARQPQILSFAEDLHVDGVEVRAVGCMAGCGHGPNVALDPPGVVLNHMATPARFREAMLAVGGVDIPPKALKATELRLAGNASARQGDLEAAVATYTRVSPTSRFWLLASYFSFLHCIADRMRAHRRVMLLDATHRGTGRQLISSALPDGLAVGKVASLLGLEHADARGCTAGAAATRTKRQAPAVRQPIRGSSAARRQGRRCRRRRDSSCMRAAVIHDSIHPAGTCWHGVSNMGHVVLTLGACCRQRYSSYRS